MTLQPGQQTIAMHIIAHYLKKKRRSDMKLGHLLEYNIWNIFLEKAQIKYFGETTYAPTLF